MRTTALIISIGVLLSGTLTGWMDRNPPTDLAVVEKAAMKSLFILQKSSYLFTIKSREKCASCHHTTLTSMAAEIARRKALPVIDSFSEKRVSVMESTLQHAWDDNLVTDFITAKFIGPYILLGLYAEKYQPSVYTDVAVDLLLNQARPDGSFQAEAFRVPLESGEFHLTAMAIRAIRLYAAAAKKTRVDTVVARSRRWFEQSCPDMQQDVCFQLLGLQWSDGDPGIKTKVAERLRSMQNSDGGWSQLPTLKSDAYATGQALYALHESGMAQTGDETYQKGINYLLKTQDASGAWIVETRAAPIQPFFNCDFPPYDENQFISATATSWSVMALLNMLPDKK